MRLDDVRRLGYSDEFIRMWNYYLCYCEAAFEERHVGVLQLQFDKPECRRDLVDLGGNHAAELNRADISWSLARSRCERSVCEEWGTA